ncbi:DUF1492 domain-containing protein [Paenibacillus endoradicis]|uniref:DUF1492 domain-containing protein n=1 Tax=Paenibacillus endoradicis TaxID=2972487 RepID=UPI002159147C|nr:DUF1492 domain-containing protein [Paenibacillus endoradicis]MCR8658954.1 DUF1492 domain-containing protein [Paenibacillus endoradicis]
MTEQQVVEQLSNYKRLVARKRVLETYSVGAGITISRLNQDDQLQELHHKLRGMPSHMYLSKREQKLESVAHSYLEHYPAGVRSQEKAIPTIGNDAADTKLLKELKQKIEKVVAARGYEIRDDIDAVLDRVAELQNLQEDIQKIDNIIEALENYKPEYAELLRHHYLERRTWSDVAFEMNISKDVFYRRRKKAILEYAKLAN